MIETYLKIVSFLFLIWCTLLRPVTVVCPSRWHVDGVRPDGSTRCVPNPTCPKDVDCMDYDGTWQKPDRSVQPSGDIRVRVYCTGGLVPVIVDDRVVSCQSRH